MTKPYPRTRRKAHRYSPDALASALRVDRAGLIAEAKRRLGHTGSAFTYAQMDKGWLEPTADRISVKLGLHPWSVWPEMCEHHIEELGQRAKRERECSHCGILHPRLDLEYCSKRCSNNAADARSRARAG